MNSFNSGSTSIIITLAGACFVLFIFHSKRVSWLKKTLAIEAAKAEFIRQAIPAHNVPFDSVYAKNDTVSFYKDGVLVRKSVLFEE